MREDLENRHEGRGGERRQETRRPAARIAFAEVAGTRHVAATRDVSTGGLQVWVVGARPDPRAEIAVEVAFEGAIHGFRGQVAYVLPRDWGSVVGVCCDGVVPEGLGLSEQAEEAPAISWMASA